MEKPGIDKADKEGNFPAVQSFVQKQRRIMGSYIEDQLGPSALLDQVISGNPPLSPKEIPDAQSQAPED